MPQTQINGRTRTRNPRPQAKPGRRPTLGGGEPMRGGDAKHRRAARKKTTPATQKPTGSARGRSARGAVPLARGKAKLFRGLERGRPPAAAPGVDSLRRIHLLWRSPRNLALRPSHAPSGFHLVKRLLQPTLASGSVARWPHCTSLPGCCQVAQSSDLHSACLTAFIPKHDLFGGCLKGRVEIW